MSEWFVIADLGIFTDKTRAIVYNNFGSWNKDTVIESLIDEVVEEDKEDFDKILSHKESLAIVKQFVKKQKHKLSGNIRYILNDKLFANIIEDLNSRMVSNILNNLVQKGLVESAYDENLNDFIFWVKEEDENYKPETN